VAEQQFRGHEVVGDDCPVERGHAIVLFIDVMCAQQRDDVLFALAPATGIEGRFMEG
jgi:hypothetical protein